MPQDIPTKENVKTELSQNDDAGTALLEAKEQPVRVKRPAKKATFIVLSALVLLVFWYAISDRVAPYTTRATVMANIAQITPRVSGQVTEVYVRDNDRVDTGDLLFTLDSGPFNLAVRQAEVKLEQAVQQTEASAVSIVTSQAKVSQETANLQRVRSNASRVKNLLARGLISQKNAEEARANLTTAQAKLEAAKAELQSALLSLGGVGTSNTQVKSARLELEQAQTNQLYSTVTAPTLGVVTNVRLAIGQYVNTGDPAITFIDGRGAWVSANFRENQLGNITGGDNVGLLFDAIPGKIFKGHVHSIAWGIDPGIPTASGLVLNQPENHWFEAARRFPVHIELEGDIQSWPKQARAGAKVSVVVYAKGESHPIAWIAAFFHRIQSVLSYLY